MKKIFAILAAASLLAFASCDKYEDGRPSKDVRSEFNRMYPDAWDVEWEYDGVYWEVNFETGSRPNGIDHEAWFDMSGNWLGTKTELLMAAVPQNIKDFLAASKEYANAQIADMTVDYYETPAENFYRFEIYLLGIESLVDVTEDGKVTPPHLFY